MSESPQAHALRLASKANRGLIVCPALLRDYWDLLLLATLPGAKTVVMRAAAQGVPANAKWLITTYEMVEYTPGIRRAIFNNKYDTLIIDRCPLLPDVMAMADKTIYIRDSVHNSVEVYGKLRRLRNG